MNRFHVEPNHGCQFVISRHGNFESKLTSNVIATEIGRKKYWVYPDGCNEVWAKADIDKLLGGSK